MKITGSFNRWERDLRLFPELNGPSLQGGDFQLTIPLPPGDHVYSFIVDDKWTVRKDLPVVELEDGVSVHPFSVRRDRRCVGFILLQGYDASWNFVL